MSTILSTIQHAYKTELDLTNEQTTACRKHAGAARWAYNWGLARKQEAYRATGKSPSAIARHRELNALKQTDVPWMYETSKCAPQEALRTWTPPSPTSSAGQCSSSRGSGAAHSAIPRPKRASMC
jgi:hypothetical protein